MKTLLSLGLAAVALTSAHAQVFGAGAINGALLGGIAGAVIGHNSGSLSHNGWQGAAIGAGVGALLGAASEANSARYDTSAYAPGGGYVYRDAPVGFGGYGGSAAADGLFLGALGGGIIGHNSGGDWRHNGWRGAAWGAGAGWLLGSIFDANYGYYGYGYPRRVMVPATQPIAIQAAPAASAPQSVTIVNNYYGDASSMAQANALFGR